MEGAVTMVLHKSDNRPNQYGGTNYRTLCGRMNARCDDGMNVAETDEKVTCKFCLRRMAVVSAKAEGRSAQ